MYSGDATVDEATSSISMSYARCERSIPDVVAKLDGPDVIWLYVRSCSSTLAHLLAIEFDTVLQT